MSGPPSRPGSGGARSVGSVGPVGGVLVGGSSRRYGRPKEEVLVGGVPMARRALDALRPHASPLYRVGARPGSAPAALPDARPDVGPLGGIEALLVEATRRDAPGALVLACDLPLVDARLVGLVAEAAAAEPDRPVVVAGPGADDVHPLCGYWPAASLGALRSLLDGGTRAARAAAERLGARVLGPDEVRRIGDPERTFVNVNTPAGRERAESLLEGG